MLDNIVAFIVPVVVIVLVLAVLAANIRVVQQSRAAGRIPDRVGRGPPLQDSLH